jgi:hypothetical protein
VKAAVWHSPHHGPAFIGLLPKGKDQIPETYRYTHIPPGPMRQLLAKGSDPTWQQWGQHLAEGLPYGGRWTVEDVPDGVTARRALEHVREKYIGQALDSGQDKG